MNESKYHETQSSFEKIPDTHGDVVRPAGFMPPRMLPRYYIVTDQRPFDELENALAAAEKTGKSTLVIFGEFKAAVIPASSKLNMEEALKAINKAEIEHAIRSWTALSLDQRVPVIKAILATVSEEEKDFAGTTNQGGDEK